MWMLGVFCVICIISVIILYGTTAGLSKNNKELSAKVENLHKEIEKNKQEHADWVDRLATLEPFEALRLIRERSERNKKG